MKACVLPPRAADFGRAWVFALIVAAVIGRAVFLALPVNSDTAMFVYAGKLVEQGGRPGVDLLDNKLPGVGLLMSVPFRLLGANWTAYGGLGLALSLLATFFLFRASRDLWGRDAAVVVAVASAVWLNFPPAVYGQLQLETIQIALAAIAGACVLRVLNHGDCRDALTAGLCGGVATWAKPTAGAVIAAAGISLVLAGNLTWRQRMKAGAWLAVGGAAPVVLLLWTIVVTGMADALPETLRQLRDYSSQSTLNAMDAAKPLMVLGLLGFPMLILGWVFRRDGNTTAARRADVIFVVLWLLGELAGVVMQRRMYAYHFLVLGPPAAVLTGLLARRVRATSLTLVFGPMIALTLLLSVTSILEPRGPTRDDRVIAYLNRHVNATDAVWADDYPRLLVETDRRAGSTVPLIFLMANGDAAPDFFGQRILADWAERRPTYIAFAAEPARVANLYRHHMAEVASSPIRADAIERQLMAMQAYLAAHYRPETDIDTVRIWRRTDSVAADTRLADSAAEGR